MNRHPVRFDSCRIWLDSERLAHRVGGPAKEWTDGSKSWWLRGKAKYSDHQSASGDSSTPRSIGRNGQRSDPRKKRFSFPGYDKERR